jgi:hypothetical protein
MRAILLAAALAALGAYAETPKNVDLDRPGALDALRSENPEHYDRLVVAIAQEKAICKSLELARAVADRQDPCRLRVLMTSFPPKSHFTMRLDDVLYAMTLTFDRGDYALVPAR